MCKWGHSGVSIGALFNVVDWSITCVNGGIHVFVLRPSSSCRIEHSTCKWEH